MLKDAGFCEVSSGIDPVVSLVGVMVMVVGVEVQGGGEGGGGEGGSAT